ncbi:DUF433 domain-containing protein [Massilia sp. MB5]|uniref:DUF433 domain-containing protein n=1 Tax=Massilia sp. MB5 TaxID=2919578 RepID=UPI001F11354D|nr:DUF433 domain-containing protein [Massilia sp. MB5]UMR31874.1 DUF433 domain-containing protein [Massilia sp. MB5]
MKLDIIQCNPQIMGGTPVFAGTRVPLKNLFDYLSGGENLDSFLEDFPSVSRANALAALEMAHESLVDHAPSARRIATEKA